MELLYKDESYAIIGACFEVDKEKGNGFVESVYQECLELEFGLQKIPFSAQAAMRLAYKGFELKQRYIPDFLCYEKIIIELKAVKQLTDEHRAPESVGIAVGIAGKLRSLPKTRIRTNHFVIYFV